MSDTRNLIDRAIEVVSPQWAARRYAARAMLDQARHYNSTHRGALATRFSQPWTSGSTSYRGGRQTDRRDNASMRDRGRRVYDEHVIAGGLLDAETDNVVADGLSLQMLSASAGFNREAEERFYQWLDRADVAGQMTGADWFRTSWRDPRRDGDGAILLAQRSGRPLLQWIPGDLIRSPAGAKVGEWFDGVQCDRAGRHLAYNIRDVDDSGRDADTVVPARDVIFIAPRRRAALDVRGISVYARVLRELDQLDSYVDAVTKAAIMGAIFGLIEKRQRPAAAINQLTTQTNAAGDSQKAITYENGMLKILGTDEGVYQVQAMQPMQQTPDFIRAMMRLVCMAFDMPLEIGSRDLSQVNFSGGRIGLIGYYRSCRTKQDWLKSRVWNRIVFWWLSKELQLQQLGFDGAFVSPFPADYGRFELHGREWDYNDPQTEIAADIMEMDAGIMSPQECSEKRGRDWSRTQELIAKARASRAAMGIPEVHSTSTRDEVKPEPAPASAPAEPATDDSLMFKRDIVKQFLSVPAAREAVFNATKVDQLISQAGLPAEPDYDPPYIPVVAPNGPLVTGAVINDPEGDIVGGDVENSEPVNAGTDGGGSRNAGPNNEDDDGKQDETDPADTAEPASDPGSDSGSDAGAENGG